MIEIQPPMHSIQDLYYFRLIKDKVHHRNLATLVMRTETVHRETTQTS